MNISIRSAGFLLLAAALGQSANAGLFGPSTDILKGEALKQKLQSQPVLVSISGSELDIRSKAAAVGGFLLGFIASSAMASGGGMPSNQSAQQLNQNMQANMKIGTEFNKTFQTAFTSMAASQATKPGAQIGKEGPVVLVAQQLAASLQQSPDIKAFFLADPEKPAPTDLQLRVVQPEWKLDFSMMSSDYTLLHHIEVSVYQKETDTIFFKETCRGEAAKKMPREEWEQDDFSAVAMVASDIGKQCARKIIAALGIQPAVETEKPIASVQPVLAALPPSAPDEKAAPVATSTSTVPAGQTANVPPLATESQK